MQNFEGEEDVKLQFHRGRMGRASVRILKMVVTWSKWCMGKMIFWMQCSEWTGVEQDGDQGCKGGAGRGRDCSSSNEGITKELTNF